MAKLLFVSPVGSKLGGAPTSLCKLLKYLQVHHEIAVIMPTLGALASTLEKEGIPCYALSFRLRFLPILMWFILRGKYDLVYANGYHSRCVAALLAAKFTRRPFVWHIREILEKESVRRWLRHTTLIVANSRTSANSAKQYAPYKEVIVIPNGVDLEDFCVDRDKAKRHIRSVLNIPDESIIVVNVGRICDQKNQLHAIEAAAHVIKEQPSVALVFLGDSQEEGYLIQLKERAAQLRIQDHVKSPGFQRNVGEYLRGADILIHTSRKESQGRVFLEAMAARLSVVAYDVGGISESVVAGETGFLVPFGDVNGLAQSLGKLISDAALRKQMGERGYQRVSQLFTAERTAREVNVVIERTLSK